MVDSLGLRRLNDSQTDCLFAGYLYGNSDRRVSSFGHLHRVIPKRFIRLRKGLSIYFPSPRLGPRLSRLLSHRSPSSLRRLVVSRQPTNYIHIRRITLAIQRIKTLKGSSFANYFRAHRSQIEFLKVRVGARLWLASCTVRLAALSFSRSLASSVAEILN